MKKRLISILLALCMVLCLVPTSVFAEEVGAEGSAAIQLGADAISVLSKNVNTATAPTVYFGQNHDNNPAAWRVIGYDGSGVTSAQGDITLLAAGNMGVVKFADTIANNKYAPSNLKTATDALAKKLTTKENAAVKKRTLASGSYDGENTDCVAGAQVDNAVFWPLSTAEASAVNNDLRIADKEHTKWASSYWWLRSPGSSAYVVAVVKGNGSVSCAGHSLGTEIGVRPAFNLNLNSVLFASAAAGGKPDGFKAVPEYTGNEWKLTIKDSSRKIYASAAKTNLKAGETLSVEYFGATNIGENEYISAMIADSAGNILYYGRVAHNNQSQSGTANVTVPSDLADGSYTLKLFSEQCNGDYKTDYAGEFRNISFTVKNKVNEQFTLTAGDRYYFDLSALGIPGTANDVLPDKTMHYVPFTYVGTVDAYALKDETDTDTTSYEHSLFIADCNAANATSWNELNEKEMIYGKTYTSGSIDYTLRAPSAGNASNGGYGGSGDPSNNEWDAILGKSTAYIKNWSLIASWGQDIWTKDGNGQYRSVRGYTSHYFCDTSNAADNYSYLGFRPVLEVLNSDILGSDGLKAVTLDLGGGKLGGSSDAIHIIVKNGSTFTAPASDGLTRPDGNTGSYFMWLDDNGNSYAPGDSVPADVTELTVQWTAPTYAVTLDTNGGTINNGNVTEYTYGVGATLPTADDMTYTGHTFKGWYDNESLTGSPVTAIGNTETGNKEYWAKWEINQYTVTVKPENGEADITITQDYGTPITAPTLTREGYQFNGWDKAFPTTMPAENLTITAQWLDIAVPTGEIKIAENDWKSFLNTITFDLFFKDTQIVTVTAADNSGEAVTVEYLLSDKALTKSELAGMTFTTYSAPFSINPDNEYVIYAKLTDISGNVAYINTNGIVLDGISPVITGIEAGKTYCAAQTITVDEKYIGTVKVNGTEVILDENGQFILSPASGEQTIVVTDKAGNETRVIVTVNDGHTYEWQSENGQYWQKCKFCNHETTKKDIPTINISGADKVCRTQDYKFSFTLPEGATDAAYGYEFIGLGDGPLTPTVENGLYSGIIKASAYPAEETGFKLIVSAKTADGFTFSAEKTVAIQNAHSGGTATCTNKAVCEICGESYGELNANNHSDLKHFPAVAATKTAEGNIEYWYCEGCGKYFSDKDGTKEIKKADTVTAKLPSDNNGSNNKPGNNATTSPQTGDNSNLALWIALLFISGGAVTATTVYGRKKKRSVK